MRKKLSWVSASESAARDKGPHGMGLVREVPPSGAAALSRCMPTSCGEKWGREPDLASSPSVSVLLARSRSKLEGLEHAHHGGAQALELQIVRHGQPPDPATGDEAHLLFLVRSGVAVEPTGRKAHPPSHNDDRAATLDVPAILGSERIR